VIILVLNIAPRWDGDVAVQYSFNWNRVLIETLQCDPVELLEEDATRSKFEAALKEHAIDTVIFYDHGSETGLVAQGGTGYIVDKNNADKLKGKEVFTMCCLAAVDLGKYAYRQGAKAWWGYTKPFSFIPQDEQIYMKLANMGLIERRTGGSWMKAHEKTYDAYTDTIERIREEGGNPWTIITLVNNRDCLVVWCNENPPETDCPFRYAAIGLFGLSGHKISRSYAVALSMNVLLLIYALYIHSSGWSPRGVTILLTLGGTQWWMFRKYLEALKT